MIEAIVLAHMRYLENVTRFFEGGEPPPLTPPTECSLGRWYRENAGRYGEREEFKELGALHETFHEVTERAVRLFQEGKRGEAERLLNEGYRLFGRIEHLLLSLE